MSDPNESELSNKRLKVTETSTIKHAACSYSPAFPIVALKMIEEKEKIEKALLSIEFLDRNGDTMWRCDDLREGKQELLASDEVPPRYRLGGLWRRNVWTLSVKKHGNGQAALVLPSMCAVGAIRVGVTSWKCSYSSSPVIPWEYNEERGCIPDVTIPFASDLHIDSEHYGSDPLGPGGVYFVGDYMTSPDGSAESEEEGIATQLEEHIQYCGTFLGEDDSFRVEKIHLAISGTLQEILELYGLHDTKMAKSEVKGVKKYY